MLKSWSQDLDSLAVDEWLLTYDGTHAKLHWLVAGFFKLNVASTWVSNIA